jgi:hypothetical protein
MDIGHDQLLVDLLSTFFVIRVKDTYIAPFQRKKYNGTVLNMGFGRNMAMSDGWQPL